MREEEQAKALHRGSATDFNLKAVLLVRVCKWQTTRLPQIMFHQHSAGAHPVYVEYADTLAHTCIQGPSSSVRLRALLERLCAPSTDDPTRASRATPEVATVCCRGPKDHANTRIQRIMVCGIFLLYTLSNVSEELDRDEDEENRLCFALICMIYIVSRIRARVFQDSCPFHTPRCEMQRLSSVEKLKSERGMRARQIRGRPHVPTDSE